jgi:hypothetical protein
MLFENQYQIAYVTHDLKEAMGVLSDQFGVTGWRGLNADYVVENTIMTPEGEKSITMRVAIAILGNMTLEVLEPIAGETTIFTEMLVPGQLLRLHHLGFRCNDLDAAKAANAKYGRQVVSEGRFKAAHFIYVDARETLGHFLEYVAAPAEYWNR